MIPVPQTPKGIFSLAERVTIKRLLLLVITSALVVAILSTLLVSFFEPTYYQPGEVARHSVRSPRDFLLEDSVGTEAKRLEVANNVRRVFVFDDDEAQQPIWQLRAMLSKLEELTGPPDDKGRLPLTPDRKHKFSTKYRIQFDPDEWEALAEKRRWSDLVDRVARHLNPILTKGVIGNRALLSNTLPRYPVVLFRKSSQIEVPILSESEVYDLEEARSVLRDSFLAENADDNDPYERLVQKLGESLLKPNIFYDGNRTEQRIEEGRRAVDPIFHQVRRGEVVLRAGDIVSVSQTRKLDRLRELHGAQAIARTAIVHFIITLITLSGIYWFGARFWGKITPTNRDLVLFAVCMIGTFLFMKLMAWLGSAVNLSNPDIDARTMVLASPFVVGGFLLQVTLGSSWVIMYVVALSTLTGVFLENSWLMLLLIVLGNLVGALSLRSCRRRSVYLGAALRVAILNAILAMAFAIVYPELSPTSSLAQVACSFAGGLFSGILAAALSPIAEYIGGYTTDIKLLELASLDRPLLRDLSLQAPGTWNHSMMMGQLVEAAAEAIGANPLLARVGAYYHDIGKTKKPGYFVENQATRENKHDKLAPSMSALIIKSHVKDGVDMAREHHLPEVLIEFIPQHHGTGLIEYFYEKALRDVHDGQEVDETHYRYPGPKPQTKEAGLIMLADQVEAVSRVLTDPIPAKIQGMVQKIVNKVFASGQLDECELTLRDLHLITKSFVRVLTGILHRRIEYAESIEKSRHEAHAEAKKKHEESAESHRHSGETNGERRDQTSAPAEHDQGGSAETLRRLGIER